MLSNLIVVSFGLAAQMAYGSEPHHHDEDHDHSGFHAFSLDGGSYSGSSYLSSISFDKLLHSHPIVEKKERLQITAQCEIKEAGGSGLGGTITLTQKEHEPTAVEGTLTDPEMDHTYWFEIKKVGILGVECATADAALEFSPWIHRDVWGQATDEHEADKGRIVDVTADNDESQDFSQDQLHQNLFGGKRSIMGRAIVIYDDNATPDDSTDDVVAGCCTIAFESKEPCDDEPDHVHHHHHHDDDDHDHDHDDDDHHEDTSQADMAHHAQDFIHSHLTPLSTLFKGSDYLSHSAEPHW